MPTTFQIVPVLVLVPDTTPAGSNIFNYRADLICDLVIKFFNTSLAFCCLMPTTFQIVPVLVPVLDTTPASPARSNILNCRAALICGFFIQYYHTILAFYSFNYCTTLRFLHPGQPSPGIYQGHMG